MVLETWQDVLTSSLQTVWNGVAQVVPKIVIALIIFIIGWVIASLIGRVIAQIFRSLKVDNALRSIKLEELLNRAGFNLDTGKFVGELVKWFFIITFLIAALDVLALTEVTAFLTSVLTFIPNVVVAVLILLVAVVVADILQRLVVGGAKGAGFKSANVLGAVTKWSIWIFGVFIALDHLQVGETIVPILFQSIVIALAIAFGLSFGLGGQHAAGQFVDKLRAEIKNHK